MIKNLGSEIAIAYGELKWTYEDTLNKIKQFASQYYIETADKVVIFSENRPAYVFAFYSVWYHHGVAIPVDFMATAPEIAYILKDSAPKVILCSALQQKVMADAMAIAGCEAKLLIIDEFETAVLTKKESVRMPDPNENETAVIIYTSGTTGSPKGVMLSFRNLLQNILAVSEHIPIYQPDSRVLVLLPLHHIFPLMGTMVIPLHIGAMIAISPSMASEDIMATLQRNQISIIIGVPRLFAAIRKGVMDKIHQSKIASLLFGLARRLQSRAFSKKIFKKVHDKLGGSVKYLVSGGAALDVEVGNDYTTLGFEILEGFGMTEAAPMITFTRPGRVRIGSPGEAMHGTSIRIVDGEITASGANIMQGYYKRPDETAEVLRDGWLYTGDLGYLDEQGFLFITGRKKEIIVLSNGKNVNPAELEAQLLESVMITDCGVFHKDDTLQMVAIPNPAHFINQDAGQIEKTLRKELIEPFNQSVSSYKRITRIYITDKDLPRTRLGKLQRFKLTEYATELPAEPVPAMVSQDPTFRLIARFISSEKGRNVLPQHQLEMDLGFDSLDKVSLQTYLQQTFGVHIDPSGFAKYENVGALSDYVKSAKTKMEDMHVNWAEILREKVSLKLPKTWFTGNLAIWSSRLFFHTYFRYRAKGIENIPEGPCIIASNHQSFFDGMFVASYLRFNQARRTYFYAKEKHVKQAWLKFLAHRNNIIIMDLNRDLKESIQKMGELLKNNKNLIIFPEGTRTVNGKMGDFKKTFAILSRELNVPVVPVAIKGAFEALPKGAIFPKPWRKIRVEFLSPVYPENNSYEVISANVKSKIQEILR